MADDVDVREAVSFARAARVQVCPPGVTMSHRSVKPGMNIVCMSTAAPDDIQATLLLWPILVLFVTSD